MESEHFTILIVDDSLFDQEMLHRILIAEAKSPIGAAHQQYTIIRAWSGVEAIEKAISDQPDLILLDIVMPGMSGFDVLTSLKGSDDTRAIPVIVISGLNAEGDEEKGLLLGAVDYITKPFKDSIIRARIKIHLKIVEQMRIIEQLSLIDPLTNISNRRNFDNRMAVEWRRAIREKTFISILMVDIDRFKRLNDTYGHQQGDMVLKIVAETIGSLVKRPADIVARWGGEEFVVLLPNTALSGALHVAEQIRMSIENSEIPDMNNPPPHVTVSIGVASTSPSVGGMVADMIGQADKALYKAKETGRNRVC